MENQDGPEQTDKAGEVVSGNGSWEMLYRVGLKGLKDSGGEFWLKKQLEHKLGARKRRKCVATIHERRAKGQYQNIKLECISWGKPPKQDLESKAKSLESQKKKTRESF